VRPAVAPPSTGPRRGYSAFLRGPSQVLPSLDNADVILVRRDEENLVLMRAERFEAAATGLRFAARSLAILARRQHDLAEEALGEELPWLTWLPEPERATCLRELLADLVAGAETGLLTPFARSLASWRSTAEAWSTRPWPGGCRARSTVMARLSSDRGLRERSRRADRAAEPVVGPSRRPAGIPRLAADFDGGEGQSRPCLGRHHCRSATH
jgi:hypothetical protein